MKKLISVLLILTICLSLTTPAFAVDNSSDDLNVGAVVSGFKLKEKSNINAINSEVWTFEHIKTGATLLYYKNNDLNRAFNIAFRTPPDKTGVNHIIEHSLLASSDKYQGNDVFFSQLYKTYNTFVNAGTYTNMTTYPSATMSEPQLLKMADITLDMMFNSSFKKEENIFKREGWRYTMSNLDAPLQRVGVVYNEMKGTQSLENSSRLNTMKTLFPNSILADNSGGDLKYIPTLTYEHSVDIVNTYYHPSNAIVSLYGDIDYTKFLSLIDDYFSKFDKKDVKINTGIITPFDTPVTATYEFPVAANSSPESSIMYSYAINNNSPETMLDLSIISYVLNHDGGPLIPAFRASKLGSEITVSIDITLPQPVVLFEVKGADTQKTNEIKAVIDNALAEAAKGIDKNILEAVIAEFIFQNANIGENPDIGVNIAQMNSIVWTNTGSTKYYETIQDYINKMQTLISSKHFENIIKEDFIENNHKAIVTTTAKPGLLEQNAAAELKELEQIKASMSADELQNLVKSTADFEVWVKSTQNEIDASKIQATTASEIPIEVKEHKISDKTKGNVRILSTPSNSGYTGETMIAFDSTDVPVDKLYYLNLFSTLLGNVKTEKYSVSQLNIEMAKTLNSFSSYPTTISLPDGCDYALCVSWISMMKDYQKSLDLANEILLKSDMGDLDAIKSLVKALINSYTQNIQSNPLNYAIMYSSADWNEENAYSNYMSDISFLEFLKSVDKTLADNPQSVVDELKAVKDMVVGNANVTAIFTSNEDNIKIFENTITGFTDKLPQNKIESKDYSEIPIPTGNGALAIDGDVCYNILDMPASELENYDYSKYRALSLLVTNDYMLQKLRYLGGAYSTEFVTTQDGIIVYSYRDPNIKETYDVYAGIDEFLANTKFTQSDIDSYIMNAMGAITKPNGTLTEGITAIMYYLDGKDAAYEMNVLKNLRSTTPETVESLIKFTKEFSEKGNRTTAASIDKIEKNKELFDEIINFTGENKNGTDSVTRGDFIAKIFGSGDSVIEECKSEGIIKGNASGDLMLEKAITKEETAVLLNRALFSDGFDGEIITSKDNSKVASWAKESVDIAISTGVMALDVDGNFNPKTMLTVDDLDAIMHIIMEMQQQ